MTGFSFNVSTDRNHHTREWAALATTSAHLIRTAQRRPILPADNMRLANNLSAKVPQQTNSQCNPFSSRLSIHPICHGTAPLLQIGLPAIATESWGTDSACDLPKRAVPSWYHRRFGAYRRERNENDTQRTPFVLVSIARMA
jgi:hypothetical protein